MRILIAVAHADDETLGCFSHLLAGREGQHEVHILHATNSTPRDPRYALKNGYPDVPSYQVARREEMLEALAVAGLDPARHWQAMDIADQDSPNHIAAIREKTLSYAADRIYTHAYEGGHPDHDALAFALHGLPEVWEFPLYHASPQGLLTLNCFIADGEEQEATARIQLTPSQADLKRRMLECFRSQKRVIANFGLETELFRPMRDYDFDAPPHPGPLYYEIRQHGWTWPSWRSAIRSY